MTKEKKEVSEVVEDVSLGILVSSEKTERATKAVLGKGKPGSVEVTLAARLRGANPKMSQNELIIEVYKGMGGLVDLARAQKNRVNEVKDKKRRESR